MATMIVSIDDNALTGQELRECIVTRNMFRHTVGNLHNGTRGWSIFRGPDAPKKAGPVIRDDNKLYGHEYCPLDSRPRDRYLGILTGRTSIIRFTELSKRWTRPR